LLATAFLEGTAEADVLGTVLIILNSYPLPFVHLLHNIQIQNAGPQRGRGNSLILALPELVSRGCRRKSHGNRDDVKGAKVASQPCTGYKAPLLLPHGRGLGKSRDATPPLGFIGEEGSWHLFGPRTYAYAGRPRLP
jgi:hypothetical protein